MKIEVKNLLNQPEGSTENCPLQIAALPVDETNAQINGGVTLTNLGDFILANITGQANLNQPCSRCLKEVALTVPLNFSREFKEEGSLDSARDDGGEILKRVQDDGKEDGESYPIVDGIIDLTPLLTEEIIASIPVKILCFDACLGLCPKCGTNLNDNPCKCDKVEFEIHNKINL